MADQRPATTSGPDDDGEPTVQIKEALNESLTLTASTSKT
jgi:hypothetical protein